MLSEKKNSIKQEKKKSEPRRRREGRRVCMCLQKGLIFLLRHDVFPHSKENNEVVPRL
jgi:hypothetical protein